MTKHVIFCLPFLERPTKHVIKALEDSIPLVIAAGWTEGMAQEIGCAYVSMARATMLRKALDAKADAIVFIDYDLSWKPGDLLRLLETEGDVVAGTYRYKKPEEEYMGGWHTDAGHRPVVRADGCLRAGGVPAGFLKVTASAVDKFMGAYPDLVYGPRYHPSVDLFNHGAHEGRWWGEDMAFARRWNDKCGDIWLIPDLNITHWAGDTPYPGNLHRWLMKQPGGANDPARGLERCDFKRGEWLD
jgi:glycosyltransferase involved in cell wall biosynthesis